MIFKTSIVLAQYKYYGIYKILLYYCHLIQSKLTQMSSCGPSYCCPSKTSGAAYGGLPHQVVRGSPGRKKFPKPKSAADLNKKSMSALTLAYIHPPWHCKILWAKTGQISLRKTRALCMSCSGVCLPYKDNNSLLNHCTMHHYRNEQA